MISSAQNPTYRPNHHHPFARQTPMVPGLPGHAVCSHRADELEDLLERLICQDVGRMRRHVRVVVSVLLVSYQRPAARSRALRTRSSARSRTTSPSSSGSTRPSSASSFRGPSPWRPVLEGRHRVSKVRRSRSSGAVATRAARSRSLAPCWTSDTCSLTRCFRDPERGPAWDTTGPSITRDTAVPSKRALANGESTKLRVRRRHEGDRCSAKAGSRSDRAALRRVPQGGRRTPLLDHESVERARSHARRHAGRGLIIGHGCSGTTW